VEKLFSILFAAGVLLSSSIYTSPSYAIAIQYDLDSLGGNNYQYIYSVTNDGSLDGHELELFDILFSPDLYLESSLTIVTPSPLSLQWDELILASGIGTPAAYDALALSGGIGVGETISGFTVEFQWLGTGTPGGQPFEVFAPDTFTLLETGLTTEATIIPEAPSLWIIAVGLVGLIGMRQRRGGASKYRALSSLH
jgi:hypothetical protein